MHVHKWIIHPTHQKFQRPDSGNIAGSRISNPNNNTIIWERFPCHQNILCTKLNATLIAFKPTQTSRLDTHIFTYSLNNIIFNNNHIQHPTSPPKQITNRKNCKTNILSPRHNPHSQSARKPGHYRKWDFRTNKGTLKEKPTTTPRIHIAHPAPYWLASYPTTTHDIAIRNLHTFITKKHRKQEYVMAKHKVPYVDKWL